MNLNEKLMAQGFALAEVKDSDLDIYIEIKKLCFEKYVDQYFGGWVDEVQREMNSKAFEVSKEESCFKKILLQGKTVGFFSFNEGTDVIDGLTIQMLPEARNFGLGSWYLKYLTDLSEHTGKIVILKVFKSNPAQQLYIRHGFGICDDLKAHYLMKYEPGKKRD